MCRASGAFDMLSVIVLPENFRELYDLEKEIAVEPIAAKKTMLTLTENLKNLVGVNVERIISGVVKN